MDIIVLLFEFLFFVFVFDLVLNFEFFLDLFLFFVLFNVVLYKWVFEECFVFECMNLLILCFCRVDRFYDGISSCSFWI